MADALVRDEVTVPSETHLTDLITKFYNISNKRYNSKTYDNVLNIFDELTLEEQKTLIRGALGLYSATTTGLIHDKNLIDHGDSEALLVYLKKLQDNKVMGEAVAAIDKPLTLNNKEPKTLLDKPGTLSIMLVCGFVLILITFAAVSADENSMNNILFVKHLLEFMAAAGA